MLFCCSVCSAVILRIFCGPKPRQQVFFGPLSLSLWAHTQIDNFLFFDFNGANVWLVLLPFAFANPFDFCDSYLFLTFFSIIFDMNSIVCLFVCSKRCWNCQTHINTTHHTRVSCLVARFLRSYFFLFFDNFFSAATVSTCLQCNWFFLVILIQSLELIGCRLLQIN